MKVSKTNVTMSYLRRTESRGSVLSVLIQSTAVADVFEAATKSAELCATRRGVERDSQTPDFSPTAISDMRMNRQHEALQCSTVLREDLRISPLFDYSCESALSLDIVECLVRIASLSVEISSRPNTLTSSEESIAQEIENAIMVGVE